MQPINFPGAIEIKKPNDMTDEQCMSVWASRFVTDKGIPVLQFTEWFNFNHFPAMPDFETASTLDKKIYYIARQSDIQTMIRIRQYLELENRFLIQQAITINS